MSFWASAMRPHSHKNSRQLEQRGDHPSYTRTRFRARTCKRLVGRVESHGTALAAAFNAEAPLTRLPGRQRRAIARTTRPCDKNDARRTGRSLSFRCGAAVIRTRAAVGGFWPPSRRTHLRKHRRIRNSAKPRQFLGGLPVIGANQQRPKYDPGIRLGPGPTQPASEVAQVHVPEREMK